MAAGCLLLRRQTELGEAVGAVRVGRWALGLLLGWPLLNRRRALVRVRRNVEVHTRYRSARGKTRSSRRTVRAGSLLSGRGLLPGGRGLRSVTRRLGYTHVGEEGQLHVHLAAVLILPILGLERPPVCKSAVIG